jgi:DNA-binding NarL/FixJ family response regulator
MKILIADDHQLVIEAVKAKLTELAPDLNFVLAKNVDELFALADDTLDLAIVDLNMPGADGCSHVDELHRRYPEVPVMVLTGCGDSALAASLLSRGVLGFIPKDYSSDVMLSAVRLVLAGSVYVPPMMLAGLSSHDIHVSPAPRAGYAPPAVTMECLRNMLTERQMEVLDLLSQGKPNKLISRALEISEGTVKIHLAAIFRALNAHNRTEAVIAAQSLTRGGGGGVTSLTALVIETPIFSRRACSNHRTGILPAARVIGRGCRSRGNWYFWRCYRRQSSLLSMSYFCKAKPGSISSSH